MSRAGAATEGTSQHAAAEPARTLTQATPAAGFASFAAAGGAAPASSAGRSSASGTAARTALPHGGSSDPRMPPAALPIAEDPAVRLVFTNRVPPRSCGAANQSLLVGSGDVIAARSAALALLGVDLSDAVYMRQAHGSDVAVVGAAERGRGATDSADAIPDVDALVTFDPAVALVVLVADCVPLLLADPGRGVAAVHAGRRGVQAGVVAATLRALAPADPQRVVARIGPAIGGCCYEVPADLAASVAATVPAARARTSWGAASLDLPRAVIAQLREAGVTRIDDVGRCTRCHSEHFFSHRATTAAAGVGPPAAGSPAPEPGRGAGIIVRLPPPVRAAPPSFLQSG